MSPFMAERTKNESFSRLKQSKQASHAAMQCQVAKQCRRTTQFSLENTKAKTCLSKLFVEVVVCPFMAKRTQTECFSGLKQSKRALESSRKRFQGPPALIIQSISAHHNPCRSSARLRLMQFGKRNLHAKAKKCLLKLLLRPGPMQDSHAALQCQVAKQCQRSTPFSLRAMSSTPRPKPVFHSSLLRSLCVRSWPNGHKLSASVD